MMSIEDVILLIMNLHFGALPKDEEVLYFGNASLDEILAQVRERLGMA